MWIPLEIPAQGLQTTRALVYLYLVNLCLDRVYSVLRALGQCVRLASHARGAFDRPTKHAAFFFDTGNNQHPSPHVLCVWSIVLRHWSVICGPMLYCVNALVISECKVKLKLVFEVRSFVWQSLALVLL